MIMIGISESEDDTEKELIMKLKMSSLILKRDSTVFRAMLSNEFLEKNEHAVDISCKDFKDVKDVLYYLTVGRLRKDTNVLNVIELAHYFEFDHLYHHCINYLIDNINIHNYIGIVQLIEKYSIKIGFGKILKFGKKYHKKLEKLEDYEDLSFSFRMCLTEE